MLDIVQAKFIPGVNLLNSNTKDELDPIYVKKKTKSKTVSLDESSAVK